MFKVRPVSFSQFYQRRQSFVYGASVFDTRQKPKTRGEEVIGQTQRIFPTNFPS